MASGKENDPTIPVVAPTAISEKSTPQGPQSTQPGPTANMSVSGGGNRNVLNLPLDAEGKRDWSHGICDCFGDIGTCCLAWWCPCLAHARNKRRLDHLEAHGTPDPERGVRCSSDGWIYACIEFSCNMGWALQVATRGNIRQRYSIRGSSAEDFCTAYCCQPCDLVQGSRELQLEEESLEPRL
ncbi:hypothetical protein K443DRAFT_112381 [Laccaria amethystina LaAM-08-1]|uniref:PLAC8-domain-containing protein n=1 Tax=Laccaria amethystina LaAM-08-1 TaxID=1095629 RepID=A0A0C9X6C6_9AGAR|nr:hypothetical protein K443DRAFT_112381 [Laccaria amethystina LaAM-08-1]